MNDAFGRRINEGDIVVYATRAGSSLDMNVGKVIKAEGERVKIRAMAGTDYAWRNGKHHYNKETKAYETVARESYEAWLRVPGNVVVSNGIDAMDIHDRVISEQRKNLAARK